MAVASGMVGCLDRTLENSFRLSVSPPPPLFIWSDAHYPPGVPCYRYALGNPSVPGLGKVGRVLPAECVSVTYCVRGDCPVREIPIIVSYSTMLVQNNSTRFLSVPKRKSTHIAKCPGYSRGGRGHLQAQTFGALSTSGLRPAIITRNRYRQKPERGWWVCTMWRHHLFGHCPQQ